MNWIEIFHRILIVFPELSPLLILSIILTSPDVGKVIPDNLNTAINRPANITLSDSSGRKPIWGIRDISDTNH
jgi:hypothetical protein